MYTSSSYIYSEEKEPWFKMLSHAGAAYLLEKTARTTEKIQKCLKKNRELTLKMLGHSLGVTMILENQVFEYLHEKCTENEDNYLKLSQPCKLIPLLQSMNRKPPLRFPTSRPRTK